jgi:hypothetical protein
VNTIAATSQRIPRPALIGIVVVVVAFAALIIVRSGVLGGGSSDSGSTANSSQAASSSATTATQSHSSAVTPAQPKVVLLPGLPPKVAHALRYSKVAVVSLYVGQAQSDRQWVAAARKGARSAGAGFVAVNVGDDKTAASVSAFAGAASSPSMLVVRRPGKIVTQIAGPVDAAVVRQAAHNAGARR